MCEGAGQLELEPWGLQHMAEGALQEARALQSTKTWKHSGGVSYANST